MNYLHILGHFLSLVTVGQAWWVFGRDEHIQPQTDIEQSCLDNGTGESCHVYDCIQQRFPCLPHSFAKDHGQVYCLRYQQNLELFNEAGREWVRRTQSCLAMSMLDVYRLQTTSCKALNRAGWDRMSSCYVQQGFCDIVWDNREALWQVFRARDLGHTIRIWREIIEIAVGCSQVQLGRLGAWGWAKAVELRNK